MNGNVPKIAASLEADSCFLSAFRGHNENIAHRRSNWVCSYFKENRIVPTHNAARSYGGRAGCPHLKSWLVETLEDGGSAREVDREDDNKQLNGP
jgi:hypothetical protein